MTEKWASKEKRGNESGGIGGFGKEREIIETGCKRKIGNRLRKLEVLGLGSGRKLTEC